MAWAAPPTWAVSEVVTAARMQILSDDLRYLKGLDGAISIEDAMRISPSAGTVPTYAQLSIGDNAEIYVHAVVPNTINGGGLQNVDNIDLWFNYTGYNGSTTRDRNLLIGDGKNNQIAAFIGSTRNMGIGTGAPQGRVHAVGAGGGFMFLSHNGVGAGLVTLAVAGTVTTGASFFGYIRNNGGTGAAFSAITQSAVALGGTMVNNVTTAADQVTTTITAGGAITVQRTNGANSHAIDFLVVYQ